MFLFYWLPCTAVSASSASVSFCLAAPAPLVNFFPPHLFACVLYYHVSLINMYCGLAVCTCLSPTGAPPPRQPPHTPPPAPQSICFLLEFHVIGSKFAQLWKMLIIRQLWAAVVVFIVWAETNGSQAPKITFINIAEIGLRLCEFFFFWIPTRSYALSSFKSWQMFYAHSNSSSKNYSLI